MSSEMGFVRKVMRAAMKRGVDPRNSLDAMVVMSRQLARFGGLPRVARKPLKRC